MENIDDQVVGKGNNQSGLPDEFAPEKEEVELISEDKIAAFLIAKPFKDKLKALDTLLDKKELLVSHINLFTDLLKESNPKVIEKTLVLLNYFVDEVDKEYIISENVESKTKGFKFKTSLSNLITKVLISPKQNIKDLGMNCVPWFVKAIEPEDLSELLDKELKTAKNPKLITGVCSVINSTVEYYGFSKLDLKKLLPGIIKIANTGTNVTKEVSVECLQNISDYMPPEIFNSLIGKESLSKGPKEHIDKHQEEKVKDKVNRKIPTFVLEQKKLQSNVSSPDIKQGHTQENIQDDMNFDDLIEEVNIWNKFTSKWCKSVLEKKKWNEKNALLEDLRSKTNEPKLANGDYKPVFAMIKQLFGDSHIKNSTISVEILGNIANGMKHLGVLHGPCKNLQYNTFLLLRSKDKNMVATATETQIKMLPCIKIEEFANGVSEHLNDKNPDMKIHLMNLCKRVLTPSETNDPDLQNWTEVIGKMHADINKLSNDASPDVRKHVKNTTAQIESNFIGYVDDDYFSDTKRSKTPAKVIKKNDKKDEQESAKKNVKPGKSNLEVPKVNSRQNKSNSKKGLKSELSRSKESARSKREDSPAEIQNTPNKKVVKKVDKNAKPGTAQSKSGINLKDKENINEKAQTTKNSSIITKSPSTNKLGKIEIKKPMAEVVTRIEEELDCKTMLVKVLGKTPASEKIQYQTELAESLGSKWELDEILPTFISKKLSTNLMFSFLSSIIENEKNIDVKNFLLLLPYNLDRYAEKANTDKAKEFLEYCQTSLGPKTFLTLLVENYYTDKRFQGKLADKFLEFVIDIFLMLKIDWTGLLPWVQLFRGFLYLHTITQVENGLKKFAYIFKRKLGSNYFLVIDEFKDLENSADIDEIDDFKEIELNETNFRDQGLTEFGKIATGAYSNEEFYNNVGGNLDVSILNQTRTSAQVNFENDFPVSYDISILDISKELTVILKHKSPNDKIKFEDIKETLLKRYKTVMKTLSVTEHIQDFFATLMGDSNKSLQKQSTQFCALFLRTMISTFKISKKFTNVLPPLVKDKNHQTREEAIFIQKRVIQNDHKLLKMAFSCQDGSADSKLDCSRMLRQFLGENDQLIGK